MKLSDFDYNLDESLIAQLPSQKRENSRLMHLNRAKKNIEHKFFYDIVDALDENDFLVLNDTKVFPARIFAQKLTGANIEIFLLKELEPKVWEVLLKPAKRVRVDDILVVGDKLKAKLLEKDSETCKYYSVAVLKNLEIKPSPDFIQRRITACGMRPINNIVDITNYVMLQFGTPQHAFDLDKLNNYLCVRYATNDETLVTIDEVERNLSEQTVVIATKE